MPGAYRGVRTWRNGDSRGERGTVEAMTEGGKIALLVGGGLAAIGIGIGVGVAITRKKQGVTGGIFGKTEVRKLPKKAGMTVTTYTAKKEIPIKERVAIIQDLIHEGVKQPELRKLALQITRTCPARDGTCESRAIYEWVRRNIRYTGDIAPHKHGRNGAYEPIDLFQRADRTIEFGGGDCDDHTILVSTIAILNGIQAKARVTSRNAGPQEDYTHIYPVLGVPKMRPQRWLAADTTLPGRYFGVEAPHAKRLDFAA